MCVSIRFRVNAMTVSVTPHMTNCFPSLSPFPQTFMLPFYKFKTTTSLILRAYLFYINTVPPYHLTLHSWKRTGGVEVYLHSFFDLGTIGGGERSASDPGRFTPNTHRIGDRVSTRAGLDAAVAKRKIPIPRRGSNPGYTLLQFYIFTSSNL
jgi:hypothetical protein